MKNFSKILVFIFLTFLFLVGKSHASLLITENSHPLSLVDLGTEITINDGLPNSEWGGGSQALGIAGEDNETEGRPNTYTYQVWDLEGIFWNRETQILTFIGGFDYLNGVYRHANVPIGDVFIGENYVLDLSRDGGYKGEHLTSTGNFDLIKNYVSTENTHNVPSASPYRYLNGGGKIGTGSYSAYRISYTDWAGIDLFEPWRQWSGGPWINDAHYALEIHTAGIKFNSTSLSNLINDGNLIHLTYQCGNDLILGQNQSHPTPEPASLLLLGSGLACIGIIRRKKTKKNGKRLSG